MKELIGRLRAMAADSIGNEAADALEQMGEQIADLQVVEESCRKDADFFQSQLWKLRNEREGELYRGPSTGITDELRDRVMAGVAEALGGSAYDCTRVWSAWSCGTMGPDDFAVIAEDSDRVAEISEAVIGALSMALAKAQATEKDAARYRWLRHNSGFSIAENLFGPHSMTGFTDADLDAMIDGELKHQAPKFANVGCSQCGQEFGPGDHGFSHCEDHLQK